MYQVKLTKDQLQTIQEATNLLLRVQLGQWDEIFRHLPLEDTYDFDSLYALKRSFANKLSLFMKDNVDGIFSSFGVGHSELPKTNSIALDIHNTIRHKLAWENEHHSINLMEVQYDNPMNYSDQPLPVIEKLVDDPETDLS
jgi:hypothetical protein